jgi:hypothetical protein
MMVHIVLLFCLRRKGVELLDVICLDLGQLLRYLTKCRSCSSLDSSSRFLGLSLFDPHVLSVQRIYRQYVTLITYHISFIYFSWGKKCLLLCLSLEAKLLVTSSYQLSEQRKIFLLCCTIDSLLREMQA